MTTRLAGLLIVTMLLGACSLLPTATTVPGDTTTTTVDDNGDVSPTSPPATTIPSTEPVSGVMVVTDHALTLVYDDAPAAILTGDIDYPLAAASVDLIGGIVFQYQDPGPGVSSGILRLLPGTIEPLELIAEGEGQVITLLDVAPIDGRPNVIYLSRPDGETVGGQLLAADLQGGAPLVLYEGPDLVSGDADGPTILVEQRVNATCNKLVAFKDGDPIWNSDCTDGSGPFSVAVWDDLVATVLAGQVIVSRVDDQSTTVYDVASAVRVFDLDEDSALVTDQSGSLIVVGEASQIVIPTTDPVRSASLFNSPLAVTEGHRLGGIRMAPGPCSAAGQPSVPPVTPDLPDTVAAIRSAIVERAVACDFDALASLTSSSFVVDLAGGDPRRYWMASEARFGDDLSLIVRILNLPHAVSLLPDGRSIYVWPSAAVDQPTDADWAALRPVFNEEEIDAMRQQGGYTGRRIGIAEDGEWLFSVAGN
ncbi:MAG: hypothetical protein JJE47_15620 [Acidimicrobiia bacterium]|nr:hypothetical protein [Acidimicrobiia bacterium]